MNGRDNPFIISASQPDVNVGPTTAFGGNARERAWGTCLGNWENSLSLRLLLGNVGQLGKFWK